MATPEAPHDCSLCPRLVEYRQQNAGQWPKAYNAPVPSFGEDSARLLIVGLAPGRHGANRTGRPFTGDAAGEVLFSALSQHGFTQGSYAAHIDDGLSLNDALITNAVRCVPPENRPTGSEITTCRPFLAARIKACRALKIILALGTIAHTSIVRALGEKPANFAFKHGAHHSLSGPNGALSLLDSYHCSRYNMNTRRLTLPMFDQIFVRIRAELDCTPD